MIAATEPLTAVEDFPYDDGTSKLIAYKSISSDTTLELDHLNSGDTTLEFDRIKSSDATLEFDRTNSSGTKLEFERIKSSGTKLEFDHINSSGTAFDFKQLNSSDTTLEYKLLNSNDKKLEVNSNDKQRRINPIGELECNSSAVTFREASTKGSNYNEREPVILNNNREPTSLTERVFDIRGSLSESAKSQKTINRGNLSPPRRAPVGDLPSDAPEKGKKIIVDFSDIKKRRIPPKPNQESFYYISLQRHVPLAPLPPIHNDNIKKALLLERNNNSHPKTSKPTQGRKYLWSELNAVCQMSREEAINAVKWHGATANVRELQLLLPAFVRNCVDRLTTPQLRQLCYLLSVVPQPVFFGWVAGAADLPMRRLSPFVTSEFMWGCKLLLSFMSFSHPKLSYRPKPRKLLRRFSR